MRKLILAAAVLAPLIAPTMAHARQAGILTCQLNVAQFIDDVRARNISEGSAHMVAEWVEVARSQCKSSPGIVQSNLTAWRSLLDIPEGPALAYGEENRTGAFWSGDSLVAELR